MIDPVYFNGHYINASNIDFIEPYDGGLKIYFTKRNQPLLVPGVTLEDFHKAWKKGW